MNQNDYFFTSIPDWATCHEILVTEPEPNSSGARCVIRPDVTKKPKFIVASIATLDDKCPPFLDSAISDIKGVNQNMSTNIDEHSYISNDKRSAILLRPDIQKELVIEARGGQIPYSMNVMTFHPSKYFQKKQNGQKSPYKCRICKTTAKALALAIVAAASLPTIPKALLTAVATYLGSSTAIAAAFIASVIGDLASVVAEKLCKAVGLC